jgi:hypothetical protein
VFLNACGGSADATAGAARCLLLATKHCKRASLPMTGFRVILQCSCHSSPRLVELWQSLHRLMNGPSQNLLMPPRRRFRPGFDATLQTITEERLLAQLVPPDPRPALRAVPGVPLRRPAANTHNTQPALLPHIECTRCGDVWRVRIRCGEEARASSSLATGSAEVDHLGDLAEQASGSEPPGSVPRRNSILPSSIQTICSFV